GIQVLAGHVITAVHGRRRVQRVTVRQLSDGQPGGERIRLDCDLVASSGGWSPVVHLHCHTGAQPVWDDDTASLLPPASPNACSAGSVTGAADLATCLRQGVASGAEAARAAGFPVDHTPAFSSAAALEGTPLQACWLVPSGRPPSRSPKQFVDLQNDTTAADIELAVREGYESVQHVKRYTALGFGTDQGK